MVLITDTQVRVITLARAHDRWGVGPYRFHFPCTAHTRHFLSAPFSLLPLPLSTPFLHLSHCALLLPLLLGLSGDFNRVAILDLQICWGLHWEPHGLASDPVAESCSWPQASERLGIARHPTFSPRRLYVLNWARPGCSFSLGPQVVWSSTCVIHLCLESGGAGVHRLCCLEEGGLTSHFLTASCSVLQCACPRLQGRGLVNFMP